MRSISRCKPLLGTYVEISLCAEENDDTLLEISSAAFAAIEAVEARMSFHNPESELSCINRSAHLHPCPVSPAMHEVLTQALELSRLTDGLYDISIAPELVCQGALPDIGVTADAGACWRDIRLDKDQVFFRRPLLIDLGGIAKGYAVDRALAAVEDGVSATVNAGGDIATTHWRNQRVAIKMPGPVQGNVVKIPMLNAAVATSASYYFDGNHPLTDTATHHDSAAYSGQNSTVISPKTKRPVVDQRSFSVFAGNCMLADALTKVAFLSPASGALIRSQGAKALTLDCDGKITLL